MYVQLLTTVGHVSFKSYTQARYTIPLPLYVRVKGTHSLHFSIVGIEYKTYTSLVQKIMYLLLTVVR